jgi:hypothetical protein
MSSDVRNSRPPLLPRHPNEQPPFGVCHDEDFMKAVRKVAENKKLDREKVGLQTYLTQN